MNIDLDFFLIVSAVLIILSFGVFFIHYEYKKKLTHLNRLVVHTSSQASVAETGISTQEILAHPNGKDSSLSDDFLAKLTRLKNQTQPYNTILTTTNTTDFPSSSLNNIELRSIFINSNNFITEINNNQGSVAKLAELIGSDPILCLRVMSVASSALYGSMDKSNSIKYAISRIGIEALKAIVVSELISGTFHETDANSDTLRQLVRHSAYCASCASYFGAIFPELDTSILYTAGLFHDIGKLIILRSSQEELGTCHRPYYANDSRINDTFLWKYEHAVVGSLALAKWNVDSLLCTITMSHHLPAAAFAEAHHSNSTLARYLSVIFIANQFSKYFDQTSKNYVESISPYLLQVVPMNAIRALLVNSNMLMDLTRIHYLLKS